MNRWTLVFIFSAFQLYASAQGYWSLPPYVETLETWADSLEYGYDKEPRLTMFKGAPVSITLRTFRTGRSGWPEFDPANPFEELDESLETTTRYLMDEQGRVVSWTEWEYWSPNEATNHDSLVYGPFGIVRRVQGVMWPKVTEITWEVSKPVRIEVAQNNFVEQRTLLVHDTSKGMVFGEHTSMYEADTLRWQMEMDENGLVKRTETFQGRDSSIVVYEHFADSSCTLGWWSADTSRVGRQGLRFLSGRSRVLLPDGTVREKSYGEEMTLTSVDDHVDGKQVMTQTANWRWEYFYDAGGALVKLVTHFLPFEGMREQRPSETRFYYQFNARNDPTAILQVSASWSFDALYVKPEKLWRFDYRYR